jgi:peptidoglycan/LPS O-acetylase OafA/YrhL
MSTTNSTYSGLSRYTELDALRGIAALAVVFWHFFCTVFTVAIPGMLPFIYGIYFLVNGRASVIIFFLLSGFVLSLPFFKNPQQHYIPFILRRICRIYLPYLAGIAFAILVRTFVVTHPVATLSGWFNDYVGDPFSLKTALEHLFLIGNIHSNVYNNAIWSLIHEMRISLIFPFLFLLVSRIRPLFSIAICILLSGVALLNDIFTWEISNGWQSGYFYSLHFASMFIVGILLARYRELIIAWFRRRTKPIKIIMFIVSLLLCRGSMELGQVNTKLCLLFDYGAVLGGCILMIITLGSVTALRILKKPFFSLLGNISYSMYLNHITILYLAFYFLYPAVNLPLLLVIVLIAVVFMSYLTWKYIEKPAIALGKVLAHATTRHS